MKAISDLKGYTDRMAKSMPDKLFFATDSDIRVECEVFFDYGCADGEMIFWLEKLYPDAKFYGFDESIGMVTKARRREIPRARFFADFETAMTAMLEDLGRNDKFCIILSSVLHEIMAYKKLSEAYKIWDEITSLGADYIVIRDMAVTKEFYNLSILDADVAKIYKHADRRQLDQFIHQWGVPTRGKSFLHWLLKYPYKDNWNREVLEDYMLIKNDIENELARGKYIEIYRSHYTLPWIKERVKKDFDITLVYPTHVKYIYKKDFDKCLL